MPASGPTVNPKQHWPPHPSVEDEAESLSREYTPLAHDLSRKEVEARGPIDQQPIKLETDLREPSKSKEPDKSSNEAYNLEPRSRSIDKNLGSSSTDQTPENLERRFVLRPNQDSEADSSRDHVADTRVPRRSGADERGEQDMAHPRRPTPKLDPLKVQESESSLAGLRTSREPSPYFYSSNSGKSTFSGDFLASPANLDSQSNHSNRTTEGDRSRVVSLTGSHETKASRERATSTSSIRTQYRPGSRTAVDAAYTGASNSPSLELDRSSRNQRSVSAFKSPAQTENDTLHPLPVSESSDEGVSRNRSAGRVHRYSNAGDRRERREDPQPSIDHRSSRSDRLRSSTPPRLGQNLRGRSNGPNAQSLQHGKTSNTPVLALSDSAREVDSTATSPYEAKSRSPLQSANISPYTTPPPSPKAGWQSDRTQAFTVQSHHDPVTQQFQPSSPRPTTQNSPRNPENPISGITSADRAADHLRSKSSVHAPLREKHSFERMRPEGSAQRKQPRSRQTSPLPPTQTNRSSSKSNLKIDIHAPSPSPAAKTWPIGGPELPSKPLTGELSAPFLSHRTASPGSRSPSSRSPRPEHAQDSRKVSPSNIGPASRPPNSSTSKASLRTSASNRPIGLPPCPRSDFVIGYSDWSSLSTVPDSSICPTCREGIEDAGFEGRFMPSRSTPGDYPIRCDLSVPWIRMAWLLGFQGEARHEDMVRALVAVFTHEKPCPGKLESAGDWFRVYDTERGDHVPSFGTCASCTRCLEIIFPNLKGAFHLDNSSTGSAKRKCDLAAESFRFARYVDLLEEISKHAESHQREPDMTRFVQLATRMASIRECGKDNQYRGLPWHFIPHLPDFTVCEECYLDVVWPAVTTGSEVAAQFNQSPQIPPSTSTNLSCQLYSARMRDIFQSSCRRNDFATLRTAVLIRIDKERELQGLAEQSLHLPESWRAQEISRLSNEWKKWE